VFVVIIFHDIFQEMVGLGNYSFNSIWRRGWCAVALCWCFFFFNP